MCEMRICVCVHKYMCVFNEGCQNLAKSYGIEVKTETLVVYSSFSLHTLSVKRDGKAVTWNFLAPVTLSQHLQHF